jgi:Dimethlysulfonioproprionate lyase
VTDATIAEPVKRVLESLQHPELATFLADWPRTYRARAEPVPASSLPVLRWLPHIAAGRIAFAVELVAAVCRAAPSMAWRQTYSTKDVDAAFLDNYGWSEILGDSGPIAGGRIACGLLLLGPFTHYPRHRHEAEEIYLPLRGTAAWQQGDEVWRDRTPGTLIHHAGDEPHAMRTGDSPMLALYLWRGSGLAHKARLDAAAE